MSDQEISIVSVPMTKDDQKVIKEGARKAKMSQSEFVRFLLAKGAAHLDLDFTGEMASHGGARRKVAAG